MIRSIVWNESQDFGRNEEIFLFANVSSNIENIGEKITASSDLDSSF